MTIGCSGTNYEIHVLKNQIFVSFEPLAAIKNLIVILLDLNG